jgi:hypothetical protein
MHLLRSEFRGEMQQRLGWEVRVRPFAPELSLPPAGDTVTGLLDS